MDKVKVDYKKLFKKIYDNNWWGKDISAGKYYSGEGSHEAGHVYTFIDYINKFIKCNDIHSILDFGCGDFNIGSQIEVDMYYGMDIYDDLINYNKEQFEDDKHKFIVNDESYTNIPKVDLIIIKEVLQHLDNDKIYEILDHLTKLAGKYILIFDSSLSEIVEDNINLDTHNETQLVQSKENLNYNLWPNKEPFNFNFIFINRILKCYNDSVKHWNIWLYVK